MNLYFMSNLQFSEHLPSIISVAFFNMKLDSNKIGQKVKNDMQDIAYNHWTPRTHITWSYNFSLRRNFHRSLLHNFFFHVHATSDPIPHEPIIIIGSSFRYQRSYFFKEKCLHKETHWEKRRKKQWEGR